jgi:hypothetical protein
VTGAIGNIAGSAPCQDPTLIIISAEKTGKQIPGAYERESLAAKPGSFKLGENATIAIA